MRIQGTSAGSKLWRSCQLAITLSLVFFAIAPSVGKDATDSRHLLAADDSPGGRRIVGGIPADIKDYPWQVALAVPQSNGDTDLCGGSLIYNRTWILTAAHCFENSNKLGVRAKSGVIDFTPPGGWLAIKRVIVNPKYVSHGHDTPPENDVALVELQAPDRDQNSDTIPLAGTDTKISEMLEVTGFGFTDPACGVANPPDYCQVSRRLMKAYVPYVSQKTCNSRKSYNGKVDSTMLCAGKPGVDACQGDSGGPLIARDSDGAAVLVGVVSFGTGCGQKDKYGIYMRVSAFRAWISEVIHS